MQAFAPNKANPKFFEGGNFTRLLQAFQEAHEVSFHGFGTGVPGATNPEAEVRTPLPFPPLLREQYNLLNNNYAALVKDILDARQDGDITVMITDGVQSHVEQNSGSAMGPSATAIHEWLKAGGVVDVRILTTPYQGKYFSEERRRKKISEELQSKRKDPKVETSFEVSPIQRPFVMYTFLPSPRMIPAWEKFLGRAPFERLEWRATYRLPQEQGVDKQPPDIKPARIALDREESAKLGIIPRENHPLAEEPSPYPRLKPSWNEVVYHGWVSEKALRDKNRKPSVTLPLFFDLHELANPESNPGKHISREKIEGEFRKLQPRLEIFRKAEKLLPSATPEGVTVKEGEWYCVHTIDLSNAELQICDPGKEPPGAGPIVRIDIPRQEGGASSAEGRATICVLTMIALNEKADPPDFSAWTTADDSTTANMDKVYKLQHLLEQIWETEMKKGRRKGIVVYLQTSP